MGAPDGYGFVVQLDSLGHPRLAFASALRQLVTMYIDIGYDAETICCELYLHADELVNECIPEQLRSTKG